MALYLYQASYTAESVAAQIKEPHDRIEAVRGMIEGQGGSLMASIALSVAAGGAVKQAKTTRLLSGQEWVESLRKAQGSGYQPAR